MAKPGGSPDGLLKINRRHPRCTLPFEGLENEDELRAGELVRPDLAGTEWTSFDDGLDEGRLAAEPPDRVVDAVANVNLIGRAEHQSGYRHRVGRHGRARRSGWLAQLGERLRHDAQLANDEKPDDQRRREKCGCRQPLAADRWSGTRGQHDRTPEEKPERKAESWLWPPRLSR